MSNPSPATLEGIDEIYLMKPEVRLNPGSYSYANSEEIIMDLEGNITYKQDIIQVMLKDVDLDKYFISN